jgi:hypothetical protein
MSKEKAIDMVNKFKPFCGGYVGESVNRAFAKQSAIIACQRTIDILKEIQDKEQSDNFWYLENAILDEIETIEEIKKL